MSTTLRRALCRAHLAAAFLAVALSGCAGTSPASHDELLRVGSMHETIGQQQHQARMSVDALRDTPHFYGVGALAGLRGELTLLDSDAVVTSVGADGAPRPAVDGEQATMVVGRSVANWSSARNDRAVPAAGFEAFVKQRAAQAGVDTSAPFVFLVEGEFTGVRLHVINGACPLHARLHDMPLAADVRPFELADAVLRGTLVGVYAERAVGELTHPDTSVHSHLVYDDPSTGARVTAHLEQRGVSAGATFRFPASDG